jgi:acetaldehyde dehydrogenase/alcohol dehydrogenase
MFNTNWPQTIVCGEDSIRYLETVPAKRATIVLSDSFRKGNPEVWAVIKEILAQNGTAFQEISGPGREPTLAYCKEAACAINQFSPDLIIAVGGGSTLDAAKVMEIYYEHPDITDEAIQNRFSLPKIRTKARHIAIPTTSGTGSEVSPFNVVYVDTGNPVMPQIKVGIADYQTIPNVVLLDPSFTFSAPQNVTASTGMDAFVHAIESYTSAKPANPFTDLHALEAMKLILEWLPVAYKEPRNVAARSHMQIAATMAGLSIASRGTGLAHGVGQQLGPLFGVSHGLSVSVVLEPVMRFNAPAVLSRYAEIARYVGLGGDNDEKSFENLIAKVTELMNDMKIPKKLAELKISEEEYLSKMDVLVHNALENGGTKFNPRVPNAAEVESDFKFIV